MSSAACKAGSRAMRDVLLMRCQPSGAVERPQLDLLFDGSELTEG